MTHTGSGGGLRLPDIVTQFAYDDNDRLTAIIDANGNATQFAYDELNRQIQTTYVDGSSVCLSYDADDNVIAQTDNNGLKLNYVIDPLNRRMSLHLDKTGLNPLYPYPTGTEEFEEYTYDGLGRVLKHRNDFCEIHGLFDLFGSAPMKSKFILQPPIRRQPVHWLCCGLSMCYPIALMSLTPVGGLSVMTMMD